ncbi:MAG: hypothetical protein AABX82_00945, partial [Nanoarchaeota archaeon]
KNVVPFKESDRIVRGTILKMLTTQNGQDKNAIYEQLLQRNIKREKEKFEEIIAQLEKDGLVKKEQKILSLP